jgi:hypothetical protein
MRNLSIADGEAVSAGTNFPNKIKKKSGEK